MKIAPILFVLLLVIPFVLAESALQIEIPEDYKELETPGELLVNIKFFNIHGKGREDVYLKYWIDDIHDEIIFTRQETVAVETQANYLKTIDLPELSAGKYTVHAKITHFNGDEIESKQSFKVVSHVTSNTARYTLIFILLLILTVVGIHYSKPLREVYGIRKKVKSIVQNRMVKSLDELPDRANDSLSNKV